MFKNRLGGAFLLFNDREAEKSKILLSSPASLVTITALMQFDLQVLVLCNSLILIKRVTAAI